jgi:Predicted membrane protein
MGCMKKGKMLGFIKKMYSRITEHGLFSTAGEMAYFLILSIFPLLAFTVSVASLTWLSQDRIFNILEAVFKPDIFTNIKYEVYRNVNTVNNIPLISFSMIGTIISAAGGIWAIMRSLNRAYEVKETRSYIRLYVMCIFITIIISTMMILALFVIVFGEVFENFILKYYGYSSTFNDFWQFVRYLAIEAAIFLIFSFLFYTTPNIKLRYREVIPGALLVTVGWSIVSAAFSLYVNNFNNFSKTYGSLGAGMLLLVWLYWNSILILIGGELNAYIHDKHHLPKVLRGNRTKVRKA